jgi:tRNA(Ile2) C34 agmatinyltransferase TiaS
MRGPCLKGYLAVMEDPFFGMYDPNCPQCLTRTHFKGQYWVCVFCGLVLLAPNVVPTN